MSIKRCVTFVYIFFFSFAAWASADVSWHTAGASVYGSTYCGGSGGSIGYRGDDLNAKPWSFAELGDGSAMGGLPNRTRVRMWDVSTNKRTWIVKRDIGGGGSSVDGYYRAIDLYYPVAHWLAGADCNWTGVIRWRLETRAEKYARSHPRRERAKRHATSAEGAHPGPYRPVSGSATTWSSPTLSRAQASLGRRLGVMRLRTPLSRLSPAFLL